MTLGKEPGLYRKYNISYGLLQLLQMSVLSRMLRKTELTFDEVIDATKSYAEAQKKLVGALDLLEGDSKHEEGPTAATP